MAVFNFLETFFFISLGIVFILILLMVYHFKQRLIAVEQSCDTLLDIVNNLANEISSTNAINSTNHKENVKNIRSNYYAFVKSQAPNDEDSKRPNIYPIIESDEDAESGSKSEGKAQDYDETQFDDDEHDSDTEYSESDDDETDGDDDDIDDLSRKFTSKGWDVEFHDAGNQLGNVNDIHVVLTTVEKLGEVNIPIRVIEKIVVPDVIGLGDVVSDIRDVIELGDVVSDIRDVIGLGGECELVEITDNVVDFPEIADSESDSDSGDDERVEVPALVSNVPNHCEEDRMHVKALKDKYGKMTIHELKLLAISSSVPIETSKLKKPELVKLLISFNQFSHRGAICAL